MTPTNPVPEPLRTYITPDRNYPLANVLGEGAHTSRKRLNYTTIFCAIALLFSALVMIFTH